MQIIKTILIMLACISTIYVIQGDYRSKPLSAKDAESLILAWQDAHSKCRGALDEASFDKYCTERDGVSRKLREIGWCYGTDQQSEADKQWQLCNTTPDTKPPILEKKITHKVKRNIERELMACMMKSFSVGSVNPIRDCIDLGIEWCNLLGIKTSSKWKTSELPGRILIDNMVCVDELGRRHRATLDLYYREIEHLMRSEDAGLPYKPIIFDIRTVLAQ